MIDVLGLDERHVRVRAIDRTGRCIHQMLDAAAPASLDHVQESGHVALHVDVRILRRVAHAGLRREVHDPVKPLLLEEGLHRVAVCKLDLLEPEVRLALEQRQARGLESRVVIGVEIVQSHHLVASFQ